MAWYWTMGPLRGRTTAGALDAVSWYRKFMTSSRQTTAMIARLARQRTYMWKVCARSFARVPRLLVRKCEREFWGVIILPCAIALPAACRHQSAPPQMKRTLRNDVRKYRKLRAGVEVELQKLQQHPELDERPPVDAR